MKSKEEMPKDQGWRTRAFEELGQLDARLHKLELFVTDPDFLDLPEVDQNDMREQLSYMKAYKRVLVRRVSRQCGKS